MYTLFPEMAIGAAILSLPKSEDKAVADVDRCVRNEDAADTRVVATRDIHYIKYQFKESLAVT